MTTVGSAPTGGRSGETAPSGRTALLTALLIALGVVVAVVYWPVLSAQATFFDDQEYLITTPFLQNPGWPSVQQAFGDILKPYIPGYYEPLHLLALMMDFAQGGHVGHLEPFHRTSLALHVANTVLLAVLLYSLVRQPCVAVLVALLFGVHPQTVEPVALIAQRKVLLATFFCLWSMVCYVRYVRAGGRWAYVASLLAFVLGLLSKPTITPLPVLMLLLDFWPFGRLGRRAILEKAPFFAVAGVSAAITLISTGRTGGVALPGESSTMHSALTLPYLAGFYLLKAFWPVPVSAIYSLPAPLTLANPPVLARIGIACFAALGALAALRRTRGPLMGLLFFLIAIFPTMNAVGYTWVVASDKHVYLPMIGLLIPIAFGLRRWWSGAIAVSPARLVPVIGVTLAAAAAGADGVRAYLGVWQETELLLRRTIALAPDCPFPYNNLGLTLVNKGRIDEGIEQYRHALRLDPNNPQAHNNLGAALSGKGDIEGAIEQFRHALRLMPTYAHAHFNIARQLERLGRPEDAVKEYEAGLRLKPDASAHNNFGALLTELGRLDEAVVQYRLALKLQPGAADLHHNLGEALAARNDLDQAIELYRQAIRLAPRYARAHQNLGIALARQGRMDEGVEHFKEALAIQPDSPEAHYNLANALSMRGDQEGAVHHYQEAIRLRPAYTLPRNNLGLILLGRKRYQEALEQFRAAVAVDADFRAAQLNLADTLAEMGQFDEAVAAYREMLRVAPDDAAARQRLEAVLALRTRPASQPAGGTDHVTGR